MATGTIKVTTATELRHAKNLGFNLANSNVFARVWCEKQFKTVKGEDLVFSSDLPCVRVTYTHKGGTVFVATVDGEKTRVTANGPWELTIVAT